VHYRVNEIGDVQTEEPVHGGLTAFGRDVVAECNRLGVIVDCAHATLETTLAVLEISSQPAMISHSHLDHAERHHPRLLSDAHAQAVAEAGGLIGAWPSGVTSTSLDDFADEVARLADLVGVEHVGIGTDMDANYRPVLRCYADFATLPQLLARRGMSDTETGKVLGANALALLRQVTS
jgi:membrane dipeptidase